MELLPSRLAGVLVIRPRVHADGRGFFLETFREDQLAALGLITHFVQDNHSRSTRGTIRALHYQQHPGQPKLVRVARGAAYDVVVDLRRSSPTFGKWDAFQLDDREHLQVYVPVGFAHGFCALSEVVDVVYKVGSYYDPTTERGIAWDDPDIGIPWPVAEPSLSERDQQNPRLSEVLDTLPEW